MERLKKNNGITLIALVITIIVLLILAGISIQSLTGSGIFEKVKQAIEKSKYTNALEKVKLAVTASYDESGNINNEFLKDNLNAIEGKEGELEESENDIKVKVDGYLFLVSKSTGEITKKDIEIADGEVDSSRDDIETIGIMQNQINYMNDIITNLIARLDETYTKEQTNTLIQNNASSSGTLAENWTEIINEKVSAFPTASSGDKYLLSPNKVNVDQYKFIAVASNFRWGDC